MLKNDIWIKQQIADGGVITNALTKLVGGGSMSYGVSSFGYDVRLASDLRISPSEQLIDPKAQLGQNWHSACRRDGAFIVPPHSVALGRSLEYFKLPNNVTGLVFPKSSYARCGLICFQTVLEAGWQGEITLEFANFTDCDILLYPNEGCAQVLFLEGEPCECSYADRRGKYQYQTGITFSRA